MIANAAFLAVLTVFLFVGWLAGEVSFLAPFRAVLFRNYGHYILGGVVLLFFNAFGLYYGLVRWLFLRDTGRKLTHVDRQLDETNGLQTQLLSRKW
jgi:hypothetical protein